MITKALSISRRQLVPNFRRISISERDFGKINHNSLPTTVVDARLSCNHMTKMRYTTPDLKSIGCKSGLINFMVPKRRFWTSDPTFGNAFSKHFSDTWVLDLGYVHLKSALKMRSRMFARPSKIFVWEHKFRSKPMLSSDCMSPWAKCRAVSHRIDLQ